MNIGWIAQHVWHRPLKEVIENIDSAELAYWQHLASVERLPPLQKPVEMSNDEISAELSAIFGI